MDEDRLDHLLADAERHYHRPPTAPVDAMWQRVAEEAFGEPVAKSRRGMWQMSAVAAAALLVGVFAGRASKTITSVVNPPAAVVPVAATGADRATERLLGETTVLLAALPHQRDTANVDPTIATDGARLLGTTRLLLDSPAADNARIRNLLLDLELVLAQVARLQHQRAHDELIFIQSALNERDILPRLQSAVGDLSAGIH